MIFFLFFCLVFYRIVACLKQKRLESQQVLHRLAADSVMLRVSEYVPLGLTQIKKQI